MAANIFLTRKVLPSPHTSPSIHPSLPSSLPPPSSLQVLVTAYDENRQELLFNLERLLQVLPKVCVGGVRTNSIFL